jgi:hypothetical protein
MAASGQKGDQDGKADEGAQGSMVQSGASIGLGMGFMGHGNVAQDFIR